MERFTTSSRAALRENLLTGATLLVVTPLALHLFRGERDPLVLAAFAVGSALVAVVVYSLRDARLGRRVVEIDGEGIRVRAGEGESRLAWTELRAARHAYLGGESWTLEPEAGDPLLLRLDGFTAEESARIGELIRAHIVGS